MTARPTRRRRWPSSTRFVISAQANFGLSSAQKHRHQWLPRDGIVAFTDSDCRADEDWLYYVVSDLQKGNFSGIGGHNLLPPEDSLAAAVLASPGGGRRTSC